MSLSGKIAVVTGGARGIGREICSELLENNVKVALCDINTKLGRNTVDQLKKKYSKGDCYFFPVDVSDKTQFKDCLNKIIDHYRSIDILINNAGVADDRFEFWEREIDINCKGTVWGCILGFQLINRGGTIVNVSSTLALKPYPLMPIYGMTKAAITNLTICLGSKEYFEKYGIKVMAVLPGLTDTPILQHTERRYIFPEMAAYKDELKSNLGTMQSPAFVAECTIKAILSEKNGSLWVVEDRKPPQIIELTYSIKKNYCHEDPTSKHDE
ncbi:15-hydroxyprostaglandin dehydrogenase [NAD(+)] [Halyomorpha halys]|uniref:15-hydroxyprostaglandin dehydrogenase [NAD(+)] n=1 Tax=Halyomorpha halys TaxID=286706 RepID=UPI0006D510A4|nr:15-hydroxyprostaglandin dehydrogenase [NAD(+)] [Halyomorpha halys]